jgi:tetratricopeptide (TPR) repeat protein
MEAVEDVVVRVEEQLMQNDVPEEIVIEDEETIADADELTADAVTDDLAEELETQHKSFWVQDEEAVEEEEINEEFEEEPVLSNEKPLISPVYTDDYFLAQGERVSVDMPDEIASLIPEETDEDAAKSLMVMMSFSEWLLHFKSTAEKQKEENKDQKALKTMWQKEKLAAAIEEENEEIPENVFEMAVNSIAKEDGLASESLAEIYIKQGKYDKAIEMYRKLSLRNPQKNAYFARKIEEILKEKQS